MKTLKRTLAMLLVLCMMLCMVPFAAFAEETTEGTSKPDHMTSKPVNSTVTDQPFDTTVSKNHRIPGLVNHNGTLIATADARWDAEYDGGNIDIVVSTSKDAKTWSYSYAAYLGDHGKEHDKGASTMMDPVIISDGTTLYLLYDLFAAGWSLSGDDNTDHAFKTEGREGTGFNGEGKLLLGTTYNGSEWNYYLDGQTKTIKDSNGAETGYTVDGWFNVYDNTGAYQSNLFFDEASPFYVFPTCYFAMQKSTDDGESWSEPQLLNIKRESAWWEVLGPGSGLVTQDGNLAFTTYDGSNISLVYGKDNTWNKVTTNAANNESSIVELPNGTIRAFVKNNNNRVCYVDFTKKGNGYEAGSLQNTGVANTGWCMVSSMLYSKTKNGQEVILVSCPNNGGTRSNGTVYAFTANDMQLIGSFQIDTGYENQFFAYSDMAELDDGTVAMLYEDGCMYYSSGNGAEYSHISYTSFDPAEKMGITFDEVLNEEVDPDSDVTVALPIMNFTMHVAPGQTVSGLDGEYAAFDVTITAEDDTPYHNSGKVKLPLGEFAVRVVKPFIVEENGSVTEIPKFTNDGEYVTFTAPHFSVMGFTVEPSIQVTMNVGERKVITMDHRVEPGEEKTDYFDVVLSDTTVKVVKPSAGIADDAALADGTISLEDCLYTFTKNADGKWIISGNANGTTVYVDAYNTKATYPNRGNARPVTISLANFTDPGATDGPFVFSGTSTENATGSLHFHTANDSHYWNQCGGAHKDNDAGAGTHGLFILQLNADGTLTEIQTVESIVPDNKYLIAGKGKDGNYYVMRPTTSVSNTPNQTIKYDHVARVTGQTEEFDTTVTKITISAKAVGSTSFMVDNVAYTVTVNAANPNAVDIFLGIGEEQIITDNTGAYTSVDKTNLNTSIANVDITKSNTVYDRSLTEKVNSITSGKTYVLYNKVAQKLMSNEWADARVGGSGTDGLSLGSTKASFDEHDLWTITAVTGGYYVKDQNGKYLSIARGKAEVKTDPVIISLDFDGTDWTIGENGEYANDFGGKHSAVAGWNDINDNNSQWELYEVISTPVEASTEITFEGVAEGKTTAVVGNTQYNITVLKTVDIEVMVDQSVSYTDTTGNYEDSIIREPDTTIATMDVVGTDAVAGTKELVEVTSIDGLVSGKQYLLVNTRPGTLLTDESYTSGAASWLGTLTGLKMEGTPSVDSTELWTITAVGNGYTLSQNGKYLTIDNKSAAMNDTGETFTLTYSAGNHWFIQDNSGYYLSDVAGATLDGAFGFTDGDRNGDHWKIYEIVDNSVHASTDITFKGVAEGNTFAVVGDTKYNITVIPNTINVDIQVSEVVEFFNNTGAVQPGHDTGIANVVLSKKLLSVNSIESGKQYLIVNKASGLVLHDTAINVTGDYDAREGLKTSGMASIGSTELWTITADGNGGYTVVQNGNYLAIAGYVAYAGTTHRPALNLNYTANGWTISDDETHVTLNHDDNPFYLSNNVGENYSGGALGTGDTANPYIYWDIYEIAPAVKITGLSVGKTTATVGTIKYNINVTMADLAMTVYQGMKKTTPVTGTVTDEAIENFNNTYGATVTVARKGDNLVFTAVSEGNVNDAVLGGTKYSISVPAEEVRDIVLYEGVVIRDVIENSVYDNFDAEQPDNTKAYIHGVTNKNGETAVVFTGVSAGTTEAQVGHVKYRITVKSLSSGGDIADFTSIVGEKYYQDYKANNPSDLDMTGKLIKSLRITEGATFDLGVDVTGYDSITWTSADPTIATVANDATATVDPGMVTAVKEGQTVITATVTKGGVTESISVHVTVVPSLVTGYTGDEICTVFFYIDEVADTDPYYTMFLSTANNTEAVENHEMIMVAEDEVIWFERPKVGAWAMLWTADPWDQHALTYMASTGTAGDYFPLQNDDNELGSGTVNGVKYYKGNNAYNNIVNVSRDVGGDWTDYLNSVLDNSIHVGENYWEDPGCDGAMSTSRNTNDRNTPYLVTSLTFLSEPLPELDKRIYGVLSATGKRENDGWQLYKDGMYATVGQYVYYAITVTQKAPISWKLDRNGNIQSDAVGKLAALEYTNDVRIVDRLMRPVQDDEGNIVYEPITIMLNPPYFYTKELDAQDGNHNNTAEPNDDGYITNPALQKNSQEVTDLLNAGWTQEQIDAGQRVHEFYVVYKIQAQDNNTKLVNGAGMNYEYSSVYSSGSHTSTANAAAEMYILGKSLGDVVIDFGLPVTISGLTADNLADRFDEENTNNAIDSAKYGYVDIVNNGNGTYSVTYTPDRILQGYDVVYLMDENNNLLNYFRVYPATTVYYEEGFLFGDNVTGKWENATNKGTDEQEYEQLNNKKNVFGYDDHYVDHSTGSDGTAASSTAVGDKTVFTFTGTGFELYANSLSGTGYVTLYSEGKLSKIFMVDTKLTDLNGQAIDGTYYSLPIISEKNLPYGEYTVYLIHSNNSAPIQIDGIRIINTLENSDIFLADEEDKPVFYELRDYVLNAIGVENLKDSDYIKGENDDNRVPKVEAVSLLAGQVYNAMGDSEKAVIINTEGTTFTAEQAQKLLDNGPKNELYLYPGQTLVFSVNTARVMQLGLKSPVGNAEFTLTVNGQEHALNSLSTTVDMFYKIADKSTKPASEDSSEVVPDPKDYTVSIEVTKGVLSVTTLKICDDPNFTFNALTEKDVENVMLGMYGLLPELPVNPFEDVVSGAFYYDAVLWALENSITTGTEATIFAPDSITNRAQVVTFLWRAMGEPEHSVTENPFVDIAESDYFYDAVLWAFEKGITNGVDATHFDPTGECNRAQVVTFLWRTVGEPVSEFVAEFEDVEPGKFYSEAVAWAVEKGITFGMDDATFGVLNPCNRAQVVTFLFRVSAK